MTRAMGCQQPGRASRRGGLVRRAGPGSCFGDRPNAFASARAGPAYLIRQVSGFLTRRKRRGATDDG